MALVNLRRFIVEPGIDDIGLPTARFVSQKPLHVDLAALLHANSMAQNEVDGDLRYRVLQYELQIILSYLTGNDPDDWLRLDADNFPGTAGHIKGFISESVGLGMLTAAVQDYFELELGKDPIANFDILPGELKKKVGGKGARPGTPRPAI